MGRLSGIPAMGTGQTGAVRVAIGVPEAWMLKQVQHDEISGRAVFHGAALPFDTSTGSVTSCSGRRERRRKKEAGADKKKKNRA